VEHRRATYLKIGCRNGEKTFKPNMPLPKEGLVVSDRYIRGLGTELDRAGLRWPPEMLQGTSNVGWVDKLTSDHSKSWCETNQMRSIGGSSISVVKEGDRDKTPCVQSLIEAAMALHQRLNGVPQKGCWKIHRT
jgi:hypothetical protein